MTLANWLEQLPKTEEALNELLKKLPPARYKEAAALIEVAKRRIATTKLFSYYPETGPLRRELYPRHMEFFKAGADYRERCFMAANRIGKCITAETMIQHPDGTETSAGDLYNAGLPFKVMAWNGKSAVEAIAVEPIRKPAEPCYRVWLSSGQWFDCAGEHRLLTESGWLFFSDLAPYVPALPETTQVSGRLTRFSDVRHYLKTRTNSLGGCLAFGRLCDARLHREEYNAQAQTPLQGDAQQHGFAWCGKGGLACKRTNIRQSVFGHLSILGALTQNAAQCAASLIRDACTCVRQKTLRTRNAQQPQSASSCRPQSSFLEAPYQSCGPALVSPFGAGNQIIAYQPIGVHDIYDFTVPEFGNYIAAGVVHHNTEGAGGYETTLHLTGRYPDWWTGKRFTKPVQFWAAGKTNETTRDIVQRKLFGKISYTSGRKGFAGTGLVPLEDIGGVTWKQGVSDLADTIQIKHQSGGWSQLGLKSYQQGRGSFEGTEQDGIWLDEEPPMDIYGECVIRTATTRGIIYTTFTPLEGMSEMAMSFLPDGKVPNA